MNQSIKRDEEGRWVLPHGSDSVSGDMLRHDLEIRRMMFEIQSDPDLTTEERLDFAKKLKIVQSQYYKLAEKLGINPYISRERYRRFIETTSKDLSEISDFIHEHSIIPCKTPAVL